MKSKPKKLSENEKNDLFDMAVAKWQEIASVNGFSVSDYRPVELRIPPILLKNNVLQAQKVGS